MSNEIQQLIDQVAAGGVLKLTPAKREFQGPAVIRTPMTIEGQGCTLWAETGPVLSIEADRVSISSLNIEATGPDDQDGPAACALNVTDQNKVVLKDIAVRGNVIGVAKEEGEWRYPRSIRLGRLQPDQPHNFTAKFVAPAPCEFHSDIAGLSIQPRSSNGGAVKLLLVIDPLKAGTILRGVIRIKTGSLTRTINVNANAPVHVLGNETVGSGQDVYAPDDWQTMYKDDEGSATGETAAPAQQPPAQKPPKQPSPPPKAGPPPTPSVSIPPPPPKKQKEKKKKPKPSGPQVNLPDRIESTPAPTPSQTAKPGAFDPPKPPTPTKPLPDDDTTPTSDSRKRSKRRAPKMDSSLFGSTPKPADSKKPEDAAPAETQPADPPELSQPSVVPPPPPKKNKPADKKAKSKTQSVVPPPPSKKKPGEAESKTPSPEKKAENTDSKDKKKSGRQKPSGLGGAFG